MRYLLLILPPLLVLSGRGVFLWCRKCKIGSQAKSWIVLGVCVLGLLSLGLALPLSMQEIPLTLYLHYESETMQVASYLKQHTAPGYAIYSNDDYPVLAYYSGKNVEMYPPDFPERVSGPAYFVYYTERGDPVNVTAVEKKYVPLTKIGTVQIYRSPILPLQ